MSDTNLQNKNELVELSETKDDQESESDYLTHVDVHTKRYSTEKQINGPEKWKETNPDSANIDNEITNSLDNINEKEFKTGHGKDTGHMSTSNIIKNNEDTKIETQSHGTNENNEIDTQRETINELSIENDNDVKEDSLNERKRHKNSKSHRKSKHTAKVVPEEEIEMSENKKPTDTLSSTEKERGGLALLTAVRKRNKANALNLLNLGADIHYKDETKCNVLHYAALAGYDDLIVQLVSLGADVKVWDCNGETPLHKAARAGHETTIVTLVSLGAKVNILNWNGRNPLEIAIRGKHVKVADVLCMFGVDLVMQDWTWLEDVMNSKDKKDKGIREIIVRQSDRAAGFTHGGILFNVNYIKPGEDGILDKVDVIVEAKEFSSPFLFYCSKLHVEYVDYKKYLKEEEEILSDAFECQTWGSSYKVYTLTLKIQGVPKCNETIKMVSPDGKPGRVNSTERNEDENFTEINITITIKPNAISTFMFVTLEKPEVFTISNDAVTIQPQMDPDVEIGIPEDAFDTPGDLIFNVVETKDVNEEDIDSSEEAVLLTNVFDLSVSNQQQPKKPLDMKLPMHGNINEDSDVVVLTSSKDYPESIDDWEIVEASKDGRRKCAAFKINHFSIFTGVVKKKVDEDILEVTKLIQKALNNERQVEFFAMVKTLSANEFAVVLECALQRKSKQRKRFWRKKDFEQQNLESISYSQTVQVNSMFRISFEGNLRRTGCEQSESQKLMFNPNRENFLIFSVEAIKTTEIPQGRIKLELITEREQEPIKIVEAGAGCRGGKTTYIPQPPVEEYYELTALPVEASPPPLPQDMKTMGKVDARDVECSITVLKMGSLMQLCKRLNQDEIHHLAIQLNVASPSEIAEWAVDYPNPQQFMDVMFYKWRGMRPNVTRIDFLVKALEGMGKEFEAMEVKLASIEKREIRFL